MLRTIFKYQLDWEKGWDKIYPPKTFQLLDVQFQNGKMCAWIEVPHSDEPESLIKDGLTLVIKGTGHTINEANQKTYKYFKTVQQHEFVWHIYRDKE